MYTQILQLAVYQSGIKFLRFINSNRLLKRKCAFQTADPCLAHPAPIQDFKFQQPFY